jgi:hypothetical protein
MQCARHPQRETFVRCGKCDRPICPDCMVSGPVGVRCRDCAHQSLDPLMRGSPRQYLLGALSAFASALLLGWMPRALLWLGIIYGYVIAEATLRGGGRKRGLAMQVIAGLAAAVGTAAWELNFGRIPPMVLLNNPWSLIGLGLGVFFAVVHVRYI